MTKLVLLLAGSVALHAQFFSFGAKGGSPLNDPNSSGSPFSTLTQGRWTGGPTAEVHLPFHFSVEFDALYRDSKGTFTYPYRLSPTSDPVLYSSSHKTNAWDFPLLLKYRFLNGPVRPYLSAGYAWSHESTNAVAATSCLGATGACDLPSFFVSPSGSVHYTTDRHGPVLAVGAEFKAKSVFISPEVRLTHLTQSNTNQVTMLVGFTLRPGRRGRE